MEPNSNKMRKSLLKQTEKFMSMLGKPNTTKPSYPYNPLSPSELRLLTLHAGPWDNEITCSINTVFVDADPKYEALSYTWGDQGDLRTISIDSHDVRVRKNLYIALKYLRSQVEDRTLWIDALCINQRDLCEREAQVPRMYDIYRKAERVLAWLGAPGPDGEKGIKLMCKFGQLVYDEFAARGGETYRFMNATWMGKNGLDWTEQDWGALYEVWSRPYWTRVWVVQELAASVIPSLMLFDEAVCQRPERCLIGCGHQWVESKLLTSLGEYFRPSPSIVDMLFNVTWSFRDGQLLGDKMEPMREFPPALRLYRMLQRTGQEFGSKECNSLAKIMSVTRSFAATDERDKIYGLLAMCRDRALVSPDYSEKNSLPIFLKNLVTHHIASTQTLDILLGNRRRDRPWLPSWTPELSGFDAQTYAWFHADGYWAGRFEGTAKGMQVEVDTSGNLLRVRGIAIAQISKAIGPFPASHIDRRWACTETFPSLNIDQLNPVQRTLGHLKEVLDFARNLDSDGREQCLRALFLGYFHTIGGGQPIPNHFFEFFDCLINASAPENSDPNLHESLKQLILDARPVSSQIEENLAERCFFITNEGSMGIGPYHSQPGDLVVILFGGSLCFILRRLDSTRCELVGDAYVGGYMNGWVTGEYLNGKLESHMFDIV